MEIDGNLMLRSAIGDALCCTRHRSYDNERRTRVAELRDMGNVDLEF